jgi:hypothetical protein
VREDVLVEFERVRTLSESTAQITFRDLSRLRLNANSNATIQTMRSDPLTGGEVTRVNLVSGDFYALLNQLSDRTRFEIAVGGVETQTESADFWVARDRGGARFANYDDAALVIGSGDDAVALGRNEAAVITDGGAVERADVLPGPEPVGPDDGGVVFAAALPLRWSTVPEATGYWVEVARDAGFNTMQVSEWGIAEAAFDAAGLPPGHYHWRVAALDPFGLPGSWSRARAVERIDDATPPFIVIAAPADGALLPDPAFDLRGETEPGATLAVDGEAVAVGGDGAFRIARTALPGENRLDLVATDAAGNVTRRVLALTHRPPARATLLPAPALPRDAEGVFLTAGDSLAFEGTTDAPEGATVVVRAPEGGDEVLRAVVGAAGRLSLSLPAGDRPQGWRIEVTGPGGAVEGALEIAVLRDAEPPVLALDTPPPQATRDPTLRIAGSAGDAAALTLDGRPVALDAGRFTVELALAAGPNRFELLAVDRVGNAVLLPMAVVLDTLPPEVTSVRATRAGPSVAVRVEARDAVGLRAVARYEALRDGRPETGFLRCEAATGVCTGSIPAAPGRVTLVAVTVEDYAGNAARAAAGSR